MRIELDGIPLSDHEVATIKRMRLEDSDPDYNRPEWHFYHKGTLMIGMAFNWRSLRDITLELLRKEKLTIIESLDAENHINWKLREIAEHLGYIETGLPKKRENQGFATGKPLPTGKGILHQVKEHMETIKLSEPWDQARRDLYGETEDFYNRLTEIVGIPAHLQGKVGVDRQNPHIINKEPFGKEKKP